MTDNVRRWKMRKTSGKVTVFLEILFVLLACYSRTLVQWDRVMDFFSICYACAFSLQISYTVSVSVFDCIYSLTHMLCFSLVSKTGVYSLYLFSPPYLLNKSFIVCIVALFIWKMNAICSCYRALLYLIE